MTANAGVTLLRVTHSVASVVPSEPMPTPTIAAMSGMPAAYREPKVKMRMIAAMATPTISEPSSMTIGSPKPAPPASTSMPFSRPASIALLIAARCSSVTSAASGTSMSKVVYAIVLSSETRLKFLASLSAMSSGSPPATDCSLTISSSCGLSVIGLP